MQPVAYMLTRVCHECSMDAEILHMSRDNKPFILVILFTIDRAPNQALKQAHISAHMSMCIPVQICMCLHPYRAPHHPFSTTESQSSHIYPHACLHTCLYADDVETDNVTLTE